MTRNLLNNIKIVDFSSRLPGPLSTSYLTTLGADVYKFENVYYDDPFKDLLVDFGDETFTTWYHKLSLGKKIISFDPGDINKNQKQIIESSDAIIFDHPTTKKALEENNVKLPLVQIHLKAEKNSDRPLHDLNVMADSGILSLLTSGTTSSIVSPPTLPYGGILFANNIAIKILSALLSKSAKIVPLDIYLLDSIRETIDTLYPKKFRQNKKTDFLHNGKYPCYNIYRSKDGVYFALAAIEEKYWQKFIKEFQVDLTNKDRFSTESKVLDTISKKFLSLSSNEIQRNLNIDEYCLSIIK